MTTKMMETLEFRQMFSVTAVDPVTVSPDTAAPATSTDVVVERSSPTLSRYCCTGKHIPTVKLE